MDLERFSAGFTIERARQRRANVELQKESSATLLKKSAYEDFYKLIRPFLNVENLTNEQCDSLYKKIQSGDVDAKEKLASSFYKMAHNIVVNEYYRPGFNRIDDLFQEAIFGIYNAIDEWDKYKTTYTFKDLVKEKIKNKLFEVVINQYSVTLPKNKCEKLFNLYKLEEKFKQEKGDKPSVEELSSFSNGKYSVDEINSLKLLLNSCKGTSLDKPIDEDENDLYDVVPDKSININEEFNKESRSELILKIINEDLTPNESKALILYYGFNGGEKLTYPQIAEIMGVKTSTVCNYVLDAQASIKIILESKYGISSIEQI